MSEPTQNVQLTIKSPQATQVLTVRRGLGFQAVCARTETAIEFSCRQADCGICIVRIDANAENLSPPTVREADFLKAMRADADERLACQCRIMGDITVSTDYL